LIFYLALNSTGSKATATLTADRTVLPAGGRVALTCSVDQSHSWKYDWFRRTSVSSKAETVRDTDQPHTVITQGGVYTCRGRRGQPEFSTPESSKVTIKETVPSRVTVPLQPSWSVIYRGEKITVRCEIQGGGDTGWTYEWRTTSSNNPPSHSEYTISRVTESHSGGYWCRGISDYYLTEWSRVMTLTVSPNKPQASLTAGSRVLPAGGRVTLTCSVNPSPGWKYYWYRENKLSEPLNRHDAVSQTTGTTSVSQEGLYWCRGGRGDPVYYTHFSQAVRIDTIVSNTAVVTLQPNWTEIYRGETITVSCEIQGGGDTEWTYEWETNISLKPSNQHEYRISSASSSHSGDYRCRGRMKSAQHNTTEWSDSVKLTVYDSKSDHISLSPDRAQHFNSDSVSLSCEGNSTEWRVRRFDESNYLSHCSDWGRMTGSTCNIYSYGPSNAVYWCESGSGEFSNTVNITVQNYYTHGIILLSPVRPVTEGESVTLGCKLKTEHLSSVFFYQNDKLIQNGSRVELNISAVSQSDEGFYKCQSSGRVSAQSWMSVKGETLIIKKSLISSVFNTNPTLLLTDPCCNRFVQHALLSHLQ
uniref:Ig-like domain-containing protein n=1 Tax=Seriola dumerili TaxID=41447 RepID=A0A3B4VSF2_SERDU